MLESLKNLAPSFENELKSEIQIVVSQDENGAVDDSSVYEYVSPVATDPESDPIVMSFSGLDGVEFALTQVNEDNSFSLHLDRGLITESGSFTLKVSLGDEINPDTSSYSIKIEVTFNAYD